MKAFAQKQRQYSKKERTAKVNTLMNKIRSSPFLTNNTILRFTPNRAAPAAAVARACPSSPSSSLTNQGIDTNSRPKEWLTR